jgi:hypothetical protein
MKRELSLRLLRSILPDPPWSEERLQELVSELDVLAEHKYNFYEMYQPGQLFFENLYLWLSVFTEEERTTALNFVRENLIFISREEFQQLARVLYDDRIYQRQIDIASYQTGLPRHRVRMLAESAEMQRIKRSSLYVAMSDGARIDYFRRQNLSISNEQVLPTYYPSEDKAVGLINDLEKSLGKDARFECLFLIDDFCGSGRTLLREVVKVGLDAPLEGFIVPQHMKARLSYRPDNGELALAYGGNFDPQLEEKLLALGDAIPYRGAVKELMRKYAARETELAGSLKRIASDSPLPGMLSENARVYLCPLLVTQYALDRLNPLLSRLPAPLNAIEILPGAVLPNSVRVRPPTGSQTSGETISTLCESHYSEEYEDEHTGSIKYGYDDCGLPLVLHHNTPNNSIYLLWSRRMQNPLFVRYERHGREAS